MRILTPQTLMYCLRARKLIVYWIIQQHAIMSTTFLQILLTECNTTDARPYVMGERVNNMFLFTPPEQYEVGFLV